MKWLRRLRMVVYFTIFIILPTIGFYTMLNGFRSPVLLTGIASFGFAWVQIEMFHRALRYEYLTQFMKVEKRNGLYLLSRREK